MSISVTMKNLSTEGWWKKRLMRYSTNYEKGKYGAGYNHYFYPRVFELLLRLRANYFWPAMWGSMFGVDDTANQAIADAYGIVMGTSHTGTSLRSFFFELRTDAKQNQ